MAAMSRAADPSNTAEISPLRRRDLADSAAAVLNEVSNAQKNVAHPVAAIGQKGGCVKSQD
jgi:hypothetical protein